MKIIPKEHFLIQILKRGFELSAIPKIHTHVVKNLSIIGKNKPHEWSNGSSTIVYMVDDNETIHLITGWIGSRRKETK